MRRPLWVAGLVLALAVAGGFAWLGQWQLSFAIQTDDDPARLSETVRPLTELTNAGAPVDDGAAGMVADTAGSLVAGDFRVVENRVNGGATGAWVTGHLDTSEGHLAVAIGWAPSAEEARAAIPELETVALAGDPLSVTGRYMPPEGAIVPGPTDDPARLMSMAPAQLVNLWQPFEGAAYPGYLVVHPAPSADALAASGLIAIDSVPPLPVERINWLNLFYAVEWVVFAGFAVFFWYRLARDAWEKEHELRLLADAHEQDPRRS